MSRLRLSYRLGKKGERSVSRIRGPQFFQKARITECFSQLRQDLQVFVRGVLRHQQAENKIDRLTVQGIKIDRCTKLQKSADGLLQSRDTSMGNGDPETEARAPQAFPRHQAITRSPGLCVCGTDNDKLAERFQRSFLASRLRSAAYAFGTQDIGNGKHRVET